MTQQRVGHPDSLDAGSFPAGVLIEPVATHTLSAGNFTTFQIATDVAPGVIVVSYRATHDAFVAFDTITLNGALESRSVSTVTLDAGELVVVPLENQGGGFTVLFANLDSVGCQLALEVFAYYRMPYELVYPVRTDFVISDTVPMGGDTAARPNSSPPFYDQVALIGTAELDAHIDAVWSWPRAEVITQLVQATQTVLTIPAGGAASALLEIVAPNLQLVMVNDDGGASNLIDVTARYRRFV